MKKRFKNEARELEYPNYPGWEFDDGSYGGGMGYYNLQIDDGLNYMMVSPPSEFDGEYIDSWSFSIVIDDPESVGCSEKMCEYEEGYDSFESAAKAAMSLWNANCDYKLTESKRSKSSKKIVTESNGWMRLVESEDLGINFRPVLGSGHWYEILNDCRDNFGVRIPGYFGDAIDSAKRKCNANQTYDLYFATDSRKLNKILSQLTPDQSSTVAYYRTYSNDNPWKKVTCNTYNNKKYLRVGPLLFKSSSN